jgi:hypothetical protein
MHNWKRRMTALSFGLMATMLVLVTPAAADPPGGPPTGPHSLNQVIANLQGWVMGLLAALATLFFVIGGARYVLSGGDPAQVEKAKLALRGSLIGYGLALLAPVFLGILRSIVGA